MKEFIYNSKMLINLKIKYPGIETTKMNLFGNNVRIAVLDMQIKANHSQVHRTKEQSMLLQRKDEVEKGYFEQNLTRENGKFRVVVVSHLLGC